ncbi:MAG: hypothetical protein KGI04_00200 [Candidatus Micrarchaeota archaeon]|nr:hypothetical protein [Candidatus Micrarchaeota archaeon]
MEMQAMHADTTADPVIKSLKALKREMGWDIFVKRRAADAAESAIEAAAPFTIANSEIPFVREELGKLEGRYRRLVAFTKRVARISKTQNIHGGLAIEEAMEDSIRNYSYVKDKTAILEQLAYEGGRKQGLSAGMKHLGLAVTFGDTEKRFGEVVALAGSALESRILETKNTKTEQFAQDDFDTRELTPEEEIAPAEAVIKSVISRLSKLELRLADRIEKANGFEVRNQAKGVSGVEIYNGVRGVLAEFERWCSTGNGIGFSRATRRFMEDGGRLQIGYACDSCADTESSALVSILRFAVANVDTGEELLPVLQTAESR